MLPRSCPPFPLTAFAERLVEKLSTAMAGVSTGEGR